MADFLSCDWGTSSFRLRLVAQGKVIAEVRDQVGVKVIFERAAGGAREELFAEHLRGKLEKLRPEREGLPLVISGMASSSIGWRELEYARAPFALDGSGLRVEKLEWRKPEWIGETWLVSGVATERDMMRGEETQILGLMRGRAEREVTLVLPGTHSKHVKIRGGSVVDFQTFMTGELFEVLGRGSILKATLEAGATVEKGGAFREGVEVGARGSLLGNLFSVRARGVLGKISGRENISYLSGMLIGAELAAVEGPVLLAAAEGLAELYGEALQILRRVEWRKIEDFEMAVVRGQEMILK